MKFAAGLLMFVWLPLAVQAETEGEAKRTFRQFGAMAVIGEDSGWSSPGWGLSTKEFTFFDAGAPEGPYYAFFSGNIAHEAQGQSIADTRIVTLGWRLSVPLTALHVDASLSPVVGARFRDKTELGSTYTGLAAALAATWSLRDDLEIGLSWEPVCNLATWGNPAASNLSYQDFVVSVILKEHTATRKLAW